MTGSIVWEKLNIAYNKSFGFEVHDIRYGGLMMRFDTTKAYITAYLSGEMACIEELEQERLRFDCAPEESDPVNGKFLWYTYQGVATAGNLR